MVSAFMLAACVRSPVDRPREGAPPGATAAEARDAGVPPTLAPAANLVTTQTPRPETAPPLSPIASPAGSPGLYPIISQIRPAPGAELPPGDVTIGARVTGSSPLVDVQAFVDGEPQPAPIGNPPTTTVAVNMVRQLGVGTHEVRIQARDDRGQVGGYRWQFVVGTREPVPTPTRAAPPTARALPTFGLPTLVPRAAPAPSPRPR